MNSDQFSEYCKLLGISKEKLKNDLTTLNLISTEQVHVVHYSTLSSQEGFKIHDYELYLKN